MRSQSCERSSKTLRALLGAGLLAMLALGFSPVRVNKAASAAATTTIVLNSIASGEYDNVGYYFIYARLYRLEIPNSPPLVEMRNFFVFDLSAVAAPIIGARLQVTNSYFEQIGYSGDFSWNMYDVSTTLNELTNGTGGVAAYNDLGSGNFYGSAQIGVFNNNLGVSNELNTQGLVDLNLARGGFFAVGGALGPTNCFEFACAVVGFVAPPVRQLVLEVAGGDQLIQRRGDCELKTIPSAIYAGLDNAFTATGKGVLDSLRFTRASGGVAGWIAPLSQSKSGQNWTAQFANANADGTIAIAPGNYIVHCFGPSGTIGAGKPVTVIGP